MIYNNLKSYSILIHIFSIYESLFFQLSEKKDNLSNFTINLIITIRLIIPIESKFYFISFLINFLHL